MIRLLLSSSLLLAALGVRCAPPNVDRSQADLFSLHGTVLSEPEMRPLPGTLIEVESSPRRRVTTDSAGQYRIDSISPGTHTVTARALGYLPERRRVELLCQPAVISGTRTAAPGRCSEANQSLSFYMRRVFAH